MSSFGTSSGLQVVTFLSSDDLQAVLPNNERLCTLDYVCKHGSHDEISRELRRPESLPKAHAC